MYFFGVDIRLGERRHLPTWSSGVVLKTKNIILIKKIEAEKFEEILLCIGITDGSRNF